MVDLADRRLGPLVMDGSSDVGTFEFPAAIEEICEVQLVSRYCADAWPACGEPPERSRCGRVDAHDGRPNLSRG